MIITFCGHSKFVYDEITENKLFDELKKFAKYDSLTLYCGGYGNFDLLAKKCGRKLKEIDSETRVVFVTPYITETYLKNKDSKEYDAILYPDLENVPPKFAIIERNRFMIKNADVVIGYVALNFGGAYDMMKYAEKTKKVFINLFKS